MSPSKGSRPAKPAHEEAVGGASKRRAPQKRQEDSLEANIRAVFEMEAALHRASTWGDRVGDAIANFAGTMRFIAIHSAWFTAWIAINLGWVPGVDPFDPFPFTFLTLCVSLEAILLTSIVLISQKRLARIVDERAHLDLQINLLAEQESTKSLKLLRALCEHAGLEVEAQDPEAARLAETTRPSAVAEAVRREIERTRPKA